VACWYRHSTPSTGPSTGPLTTIGDKPDEIFYRDFARPGFEVEAAFYEDLIGMVGWFVNKRGAKTDAGGPTTNPALRSVLAPWVERIERVLPRPSDCP
jgi:hypothetical protein